MRTKTINLSRGAFGQPSVPFLLSRRAHLLTTSSSQSPLASVSACGENCDRSLAPPLPTKSTTLRGPHFGGGIASDYIACNRALCEADAASAEALWTMPHLCGAAVIVHADGYMFCFFIKTVVYKTETTRRLPVKNINLMFFTAMGIASSATPIFFLRKRNKNKSERTVRTNGDIPLGSKGGQQRYGTLCGCRFRLSELYQYSK